MKTMLKKVSIIAVVVALIASVLSVSAFAAGSVSVKASNQSPAVGAEVTVTISYKADEAMLSIGGWLQYNADVLEYLSVTGAVATEKGAGTYEFNSGVGNQATHDVTFKFKTKKVGQSAVKAYNCKYVPANFQEITVDDRSVTINVADKTSTTLSGNANLKSLYLSNGIPLTPAFNKDTTTYNIQVENSVTKVLVNATTEDARAKIDVVGSSDMKVGANQRTIVVTAANGTQKRYVININRAAPDGTIPADPENPDAQPSNPYEIEVNGEKWTLVSEYTEDITLEGFTVGSAVINSTELPVLKNGVTGAVVVYAKGGTEEAPTAKYFSYQEITAVFSEYRIITTEASKLVIIPFDSALAVPTGYVKTTAEVMGYSVEVMKYVDPALSNFAIVYAETLGGIKDYYRIDTVNGTVQLSPEFVLAIKSAAAVGDSGNAITRFSALTLMEKTMIGAVILAVLIVVAIIVITIIKLARMGKNQLETIDEFDELAEFEEEFEEIDEEEFEEDEDEEEEEEF